MTFSLKALAAVAFVALAVPAFAHGSGSGGHFGGHDGMDHTPSMTQTQTKTKTNTSTHTGAIDHHHDNKLRDTRHLLKVTQTLVRDASRLLTHLVAAQKAGNTAATQRILQQLAALNARALRDGVKALVTVPGLNLPFTLGFAV